MKLEPRLHVAASLVALLTGCFFAGGSALATGVSGYLNDAANPALVASDGFQDLQAPRFGNDAEIARNVAIYQLTVTAPGSITFSSTGFAALGAEPYFSLFMGSGIAATFLQSNFFDPAIDFTVGPILLSAGVYMFTLGVWENLSFAENLGTGTLGDGFTALGDPSLLGSSFYELNVTSGDATFDIEPATGISTPVPEPASFLLVLVALIAMTGSTVGRRRRQTRRLG